MRAILTEMKIKREIIDMIFWNRIINLISHGKRFSSISAGFDVLREISRNSAIPRHLIKIGAKKINLTDHLQTSARIPAKLRIFSTIFLQRVEL